jgi:hypothetical protein
VELKEQQQSAFGLASGPSSQTHHPLYPCRRSVRNILYSFPHFGQRWPLGWRLEPNSHGQLEYGGTVGWETSEKQWRTPSQLARPNATQQSRRLSHVRPMQRFHRDITSGNMRNTTSEAAHFRKDPQEDKRHQNKSSSCSFKFCDCHPAFTFASLSS